MPASRASAQEIPSNDQDPVYIKAGTPAPFSGDLYPTVRSIRMMLRSETCQERAELKLKHAAQNFDIELKHQDELCDSGRVSDQERILILTQALEAKEPWYRSPAFVATVSVGATLALVAVTALILETVAKSFRLLSDA